jgi:prepilin-type N-terminal cleavage/methylation domain-containing protein
MALTAATTILSVGSETIMKGSRDSGFTVLELILVLVIITMVMAVAYPSLSRGSTALRLRATGRDIMNTFRYAREKAVTEQIGIKVAVDREKQKLILSDYLGDGARTYLMPRDIKIQRIALGGNEIATDIGMIVRFLPNGSCDSAEVLLQNERGAWLRVVTDPITGGARMELGSVENRQ